MDSSTKNLLDKRIYKILREACDSPNVLFTSGIVDPLIWRRDDSNKRTRVVLVCTEYYTYMLKRSGYKRYARWANRRLTISLQQSTVVFSCASDPSEIAYTFPSGKKESRAKNSASYIHGATLETSSSVEARRIEDYVSQFIHDAGEAAARLEMEEAGGVNGDVFGEAGSTNSSASDAEELSGPGNLEGEGLRAFAPEAPGKLEELLRLAPSRYIALTSLVDGEFADYTTLRNAYLRGEEDQLMSDLEVFVKENEGRVEALCQQHYSAFINAAEQCLSISAHDAELVGEHLSVANAMVRESVVDIKQAATEMITLRTTCGNLEETRALLHRCIAVVDYLETAESQVAKLKLRGAVISLRELVRLAAPLSAFALGEYVLHQRVPALTNCVLTSAVHQLNTWLNRLREEALPVGSAAFEWKGRSTPGKVVKKVVFAEEGDVWWLSESFVPSETHMDHFAVADTVISLCNGAGIQSVFEELRRGEDFRRHYCEGRTQQAYVDFYNSVCPAGLDAEGLIKDFETFCRSALGFILIEDIMHTATSPQVQSRSEILRTWDRLTSAICSRLTIVSNALVGTEQYSSHMLSILETMRLLLRHSMESVKSVELSPLILLKVIESYTDNLVSVWLQQACMEVTAAVAADPLLALIAENQRDFETYVTRFNLHRCTSLELNIPKVFRGDAVTLPYGELVPKVGATALRFLEQCYAVMVLDTSSTIRHSELNNVDEMLLKYLSVLFRTVVEIMRQLDTGGPDSVLKCAVFVSSCSVMPVIVSCVEQEFLLHWTSDVALRKQRMGSPTLLKASADMFSKPLQEGTEKMLSACITDVKSRLAISSSIIYWYKQMDLRQANEEERAKEECFSKCIAYILELIPKLSLVLPGAMVRSVIGTAIAHLGQGMQSSLDTALRRAHAGSDRNFNAMRACVNEFLTQCADGLPRWQQQLRAALPGLTACDRFPLDANGAAENARAWIGARESQYAEEKANQPQLVTAMGDAGKAFTRGFQAIGKSVATSFKKKDNPNEE